MEFTIQSKGIEITEHLENYIEKRLGTLDRYLSTVTDVRIELSSEKTRSQQDRQVAQVTVHTNRTILRAEERSADIFSAIDMVVDKIKRQVGRYKNKRRSKMRHAVATMAAEEELELESQIEQEEQDRGNIVRVKRFAVMAMTPDEAIEQMELLGHDFFLFYNPDEGEINVVYSRRDGNFGLLQPDMV